MPKKFNQHIIIIHNAIIIIYFLAKFVMAQKMLKTGYLKIFFVAESLLALSGRYFIKLEIEFIPTHLII